MTATTFRFVAMSALALGIGAAATADIYVATYHSTNTIMRYSDTGEFREVFIPKNTGGLGGAQSLVYGAAENEWYIADGGSKVMIFDPLGGFKRSIHNPKFGNLYGIAHGPDGMLYASSNGSVLHKINPMTGHYFGAFNIGGGLNQSRAVLFSPQGYVMVGSNGTSSVKKFDSNTGLYAGEAAINMVNGPDGIAILPNGNIAVCSWDHQNITEHNPVTGAFQRVIVWPGMGGLMRPRHVLLTHSNELLVCDTDGHILLKFDPVTGGFNGVFAGGGFLSSPIFAAYGPTLTFAPPLSLNILTGRHVSGGLTQILESDETRLVLRPGVVFSTAQSPIRFDVEGTAPMNSERIRFDVESSGTSTNISERVEMFNFSTGVFDHIGTRQMTVADSQVRRGIPNAADYVEPGTRRMVARILCRATGPMVSYPFETRFDQVRWVSQ